MAQETRITCKLCGKTTAKELSRQMVWHDAGYCSQECAVKDGLSVDGYTAIVCKGCGKGKMMKNENMRPWNIAGYCAAPCAVVAGHTEWAYGAPKGRIRARISEKLGLKKCKNCGKEIVKTRTFCNETCANEYGEKKRTKRYSERLKTEGVRCEHCGKLFIPWSKCLGFCSTKCRIAQGRAEEERRQEEEKRASCDMCGSKLNGKHYKALGRCEACCTFYGRPSKPFVHRGIMDEAIEDSALLLNDPKAFDEKFGIKEEKNETSMEC